MSWKKLSLTEVLGGDGETADSRYVVVHSHCAFVGAQRQQFFPSRTPTSPYPSVMETNPNNAIVRVVFRGIGKNVGVRLEVFSGWSGASFVLDACTSMLISLMFISLDFAGSQTAPIALDEEIQTVCRC